MAGKRARLRVRFVGVRTGVSGVVRVEVPGYAPVSVAFTPLAPGEVRDLGTVELSKSR